MESDSVPGERDLLGVGRMRLGELMAPLGLAVEEAGREVVDMGHSSGGIDAMWKIQDSDGVNRILEVEVASSAEPRNLQKKLAMLELRKLRRGTEQLLVAEWLSPKSRAMLDQAGVHCLDLTGTLHLILDRPRVAVRIEGSANDPRPPSRRLRGLAGANAGRLIRVLADVAPPYRPTDLTLATGLSPSYVTRLLQALTDHGLITRNRSQVTGVLWPDLLEQRASTCSLLATAHTTWVAPRGLDDVVERLARDETLRDVVAVTGSYAARAVAPLAAGGQLMIHVPASNDSVSGDPARTLGLLAADDGADVVLLHAPDQVVLARPRHVDGVPHVALAQLVLDCLSGPGRLPAAGQAVLDIMRSDETAWRLPGIASILDADSV